jgi:aspartate/methionine/tyrosine aminotransferase
MIFSDEIYHGLVYEGREHSILEFTDEAFVFNGFSKLFAMTGLRLGYVIAPERFMDGIKKLSQNLFISANSVSQWAAIAALTECRDEVEAMRITYNERRVRILARLRAMGFTIDVEPTGAFYVLADARFLSAATGLDSYGLAFDILEKACVGVTPGTDFGPGGEGYIRFSYANSLENIDRAMDRLEGYVRERAGS